MRNKGSPAAVLRKIAKILWASGQSESCAVKNGNVKGREVNYRITIIRNRWQTDDASLLSKRIKSDYGMTAKGTEKPEGPDIMLSSRGIARAWDWMRGNSPDPIPRSTFDCAIFYTHHQTQHRVALCIVYGALVFYTITQHRVALWYRVWERGRQPE